MISIRSLFSLQSAPLLGLDISASSAKLVELGRHKAGQLSLERCARESMEPGAITGGVIEKFDAVAATVRRLVKASGTRVRQVAMALPASAVVTKRIVLPGGLSERQLEAQVQAQASQYIPFSLDEVCLDFCVIGPSPTSRGDIDLLIAASRRERVQDLQGLAEAAGLKPMILDVESYASRLAASRLIEALPAKGVDLVVALLEVGALNTGLQVIRNAELLYEREQAFGGEKLTQAIALQYGLSLEEAERGKRDGALPGDYEALVLRPFVEALVQDMVRTLQFFFTNTPYNKVDLILLAGGSAAIPGLGRALGQAMSTNCSLANPFDGMELGPAVSVQRITREAPSYLRACGLALRRFAT